MGRKKEKPERLLDNYFKAITELKAEVQVLNWENVNRVTQCSLSAVRYMIDSYGYPIDIMYRGCGSYPFAILVNIGDNKIFACATPEDLVDMGVFADYQQAFEAVKTECANLGGTFYV